MKRFFIVCLFGLVSLLVMSGCRTQSAAVSITQKDSLRIDTIIKSDTVFYIDERFINSLFICDSSNTVILQKNSFIQSKFDSLLKASPLVRTITKTKYYTSTKKEYRPAVVKVVYEKKYVNTLTVFLIIYSLIISFAFILILYIFYRYMKTVNTGILNKS